MPFVPYVPSATELSAQEQIAAIKGVSDETLRWIVTVLMTGYDVGAQEAAEKVMHLIADMGGIADGLIPPDLRDRIRNIAYEILGEIAVLEADKKRRSGSGQGGTSETSAA